MEGSFVCIEQALFYHDKVEVSRGSPAVICITLCFSYKNVSLETVNISWGSRHEVKLMIPHQIQICFNQTSLGFV